jgi:hypothetical protein
VAPVDIATVEPKGLADPHAGDGEQDDQAGQRLRSEDEGAEACAARTTAATPLVGEKIGSMTAAAIGD